MKERNVCSHLFICYWFTCDPKLTSKFQLECQYLCSNPSIEQSFSKDAGFSATLGTDCSFIETTFFSVSDQQRVSLMHLSYLLQWEQTQRRMKKDPHDIACEKPCGVHNIPRARVRETERDRDRKRERQRKRGAEKERGCVTQELLQYDWEHVSGEKIDGVE